MNICKKICFVSFFLSLPAFLLLNSVLFFPVEANATESIANKKQTATTNRQDPQEVPTVVAARLAEKNNSARNHQAEPDKASEASNTQYPGVKTKNTTSIQKKKSPVTDAVLPMLGALIAVLATIFAAAWLMRKINPGGFRQTSLRIIESQSLGMKSRLLLVEVEGERLLLGVTPQSVQKVHELSHSSASRLREEKPQPDAEAQVGVSFSQLLKRTLGLPSTGEDISPQSIRRQSSADADSASPTREAES